MLLGSASHSNGLMRLMKALRHEAPRAEALRKRLAAGAGVGEANLLAVSFHAHYRQSVGKTVLARALQNGVKQGAALGGSSLGALQDPASGGR